ncbi:MAG: lamin tail domain-containing protein [Polyangiaceae bacterium]
MRTFTKRGSRLALGSLSLSLLAAACSGDPSAETSDATSAALGTPQSVSLVASQDTSVYVGRPNKNFGGETALDVNRALIAFDQSALRAALGSSDRLISAKLELNLTNNALRKLPRLVGAFRLKRAWSELGATWNCPSDSDTSNSRPDCASGWSMGVLPPNPWVSPATSVITVPAQTTGTVTFDVTADVRAFLSGLAENNGWMLLGSTPGEFAEFASRETATPPRLVLSVDRCSASACDDGNPCTVDACDASAACTHVTLADGSACNDGNACTQTDVCRAGSCSGENPVLCSALDACHLAGSCDAATGACSNPQVPSGTSCGSDQTCSASGSCDFITHVVVNEVESSGGTPGDWVELYNAGRAVADVSGYKFLDNDNTHVAYVIPAGTTIPVGGYLVLEEANFGFGLGAADSSRLFDASGALVDTYSWTAHATTTYGRCPNGSGAFIATSSVTKGAANDCSVQVKINEVESSGGTPGDWVELYNTGPATADLSGFVFKDNDDTHAYVIPSGTTLAPGAYLTLEEAQFVFGLGGADSARLFDSQGALLDSYSWAAHATTTYGRCPNGTGSFSSTSSVTKGLANECGGTTPPALPAWPGSNAVTTVDGSSIFGGNLSGLAHEAPSGAAPAVLWAVRNSPSTLYRLGFDGALWSPEAGAWSAGKTLRYPDGTGSPDAEGVAILGSPTNTVYVATERNNDVSAISRLSILSFDPSATGTELIATHEWNLTADLPVVGSNLGLEAITFIPDSYLVANSFFDERLGQAYNPAAYPDHAGGLFFVGVEASGLVYAYALDHTSGAFYRVASIASGNTGVMDLSFDREVGYLWAQCDDTCGNVASILSIDTTAGSATFGRFTLKRQFARPSSMENLNNEGIAFASEAECVSGQKRFFWADDSQTGGHSLRADSIPCGRFVP